jgi:hypothetical protein
MQENRRLNDPSYIGKILNYVIARQNEDGGYTFEYTFQAISAMKIMEKQEIAKPFF